MPNVFSRRTLGEFEDAAASVPLRQLNRAFQGADVRLGEDPGGLAGSRREQFRRYVAGVDQHDPDELERLGAALGALLAEVATSKEAFLISAAERDGFVFADGVFRTASVSRVDAITRVEDLTQIDDRGKRLQRLATENPEAAIEGAMELVESVCRTVLAAIDGTAPGDEVDLVTVAASALALVEPSVSGSRDAKRRANAIARCVTQLASVVSGLDELRSYAAGQGATRAGVSSRHARVAIGAAVTLASFVADSCEERARMDAP